jgi:hypothetical protein
MRFHITAAFLLQILPQGESREDVQPRLGGIKGNRRDLSNKYSIPKSQEVGDDGSLSALPKKFINKMSASFATMQECDPSATAHDEPDMDGERVLDVGILLCTDDQECVASQGSALGGVCITPPGRKLQDDDFCGDYLFYHTDDWECDCSGFTVGVGGEIVCELPDTCGTIYATYSDIDMALIPPAGTLQLYSSTYCLFSPHGEYCLEYTYDVNTYVEMLSGVTLDEDDCELTAITCTDSVGDYPSNSFNCDNNGVVSICSSEESYSSSFYCPAVAYENNCEDAAADCDCTGWDDDKKIKSIDCGEDECINFNFDKGSYDEKCKKAKKTKKGNRW